MAYEPPILHAIRTIFIGGGGGLQFVEAIPECKCKIAMQCNCAVILILVNTRKQCVM